MVAERTTPSLFGNTRGSVPGLRENRLTPASDRCCVPTSHAHTISWRPVAGGGTVPTSRSLEATVPGGRERTTRPCVVSTPPPVTSHPGGLVTQGPGDGEARQAADGDHLLAVLPGPRRPRLRGDRPPPLPGGPGSVSCPPAGTLDAPVTTPGLNAAVTPTASDSGPSRKMPPASPRGGRADTRRTASRHLESTSC